MKYVESITSFFDNPKWVMNLIFGGLCVLIPVVGPIVLMGWLITILWAPRTVSIPTAEPFDFGKFSFYLERGLWPFLVNLAAGVGLSIVLTILAIIPSIVIGLIFNHGRFLQMIGSLIMFVIWIVLFVAIAAVMIPVLIRAILLQDFAKAFDFAWIKKFALAMWMDILISVIFLFVASLVLMPIGILACGVGLYAAAALLNFAAYHLMRQLYDLYLTRGGEPVPMSPKLTALPPAPAAPLA